MPFAFVCHRCSLQSVSDDPEPGDCGLCNSRLERFDPASGKVLPPGWRACDVHPNPFERKDWRK